MFEKSNKTCQFDLVFSDYKTFFSAKKNPGVIPHLMIKNIL